MHDRHLAKKDYMARTPFECYHWAKASQLFNLEISKDISVWDRDAVFMASVFMSYIMGFAVEAQHPEDVWPLSSALTSNLPWLPIQKGLRTIWEMTEPYRPDGMMAKNLTVKVDERCLGLPSPLPGIEGLSPALVKMCELDVLSVSGNNPYHTAVRILSPLMDDPSLHLKPLRFLSFANTIEPEFEDLLKQRDPRALVLMALWYGLVPDSAWWFSLRSTLEREAIVLYLRRYHAEDAYIQHVLATL